MTSLEELIQKEGNRLDFNYKGYQCRILRPKMLDGLSLAPFHLAGYAALPKSHYYYETPYDSIPVEVHGGLTYGEIERDGQFWIGFDCAHLGDKAHFDLPGFPKNPGVYRDMEYVKKELESLVDQLIQHE